MWIFALCLLSFAGIVLSSLLSFQLHLNFLLLFVGLSLFRWTEVYLSQMILAVKMTACLHRSGWCSSLLRRRLTAGTPDRQTPWVLSDRAAQWSDEERGGEAGSNRLHQSGEEANASWDSVCEGGGLTSERALLSHINLGAPASPACIGLALITWAILHSPPALP